MNDDGIPTITIQPEPTPEELVAIVSAVTAALREGTRALPYDNGAHRSPSSRWAKRGRRDAMRGRDEEGIGRR